MKTPLEVVVSGRHKSVLSISLLYFLGVTAERQLTQHNMTVENRLALLLDLQLPALLGVFHFVQYIGTAPRTSQHIMGICKRLVILERQKSIVRPRRFQRAVKLKVLFCWCFFFALFFKVKQAILNS